MAIIPVIYQNGFIKSKVVEFSYNPSPLQSLQHGTEHGPAQINTESSRLQRAQNSSSELMKFCFFLTFQCKHWARLSNQSLTGSRKQMEGTGKQEVVMVILERDKRIGVTEADVSMRKDMSKQGKKRGIDISCRSPPRGKREQVFSSSSITGRSFQETGR